MSCTHHALTSCRSGFAAIVILGLTACSNGGSSGTTPASSPLAVSGSVGDGPVANATLTFEDANGEVIGTSTSDASAKYSIEIPTGTLLPVVIRANGGTDMVSGRELDFELVAVANVDADSTVNLTPQSTLTVATAQCSDNNLTAEALRETWNRARAQIGLGLDADLLADPMTESITAENAANVVLATEALSEIIRRTVDTLNQGSDEPVDGNAVISELGCDLAFGTKIDGQAAKGLIRSGAVYRAAEAAVMLEVMSGDLQVGGASANALMDAAVRNIIEPGLTAPSVTEVPVDETLVNQALESLLLVQSIDSSDAALLDVVDALVESQPEELRAMIRSELDAAARGALLDVGAVLANARGTAARELAESSQEQAERRAPFISLTADRFSLAPGQSTRVSWASSSADRCIASGSDDWAGPVALSGRYVAEGLRQSTEFEIRCYGSGGTNRAAIKVLVNEETSLVGVPEDVAEDDGTADEFESPLRTPTPPVDGGADAEEDLVAEREDDAPVEQAPVEQVEDDVSVSLRSSAVAVSSGGFVTLNWSSRNADSCSATRGWTGAQSTSGSTEVGPITQNTTFALSCSGAQGATESTVTVSVRQAVVISWQAPQENVDGTPIDGLSGYRVFYGEAPGSYSEEASVNDPAATSLELALAPGSYYVAMTAVASDGTQSALSNEIVIQNP